MESSTMKSWTTSRPPGRKAPKAFRYNGRRACVCIALPIVPETQGESEEPEKVAEFGELCH